MKDVKSDLRENEGRWHTVGPIWFKHFSPRLSQLIERSDQRKMIGTSARASLLYPYISKIILPIATPLCPVPPSD